MGRMPLLGYQCRSRIYSGRRARYDSAKAGEIFEWFRTFGSVGELFRPDVRPDVRIAANMAYLRVMICNDDVEVLPVWLPQIYLLPFTRGGCLRYANVVGYPAGDYLRRAAAEIDRRLAAYEKSGAAQPEFVYDAGCSAIGEVEDDAAGRIAKYSLACAEQADGTVAWRLADG